MAYDLYQQMLALLAAIVVLGAVCGLWLMARTAINAARAVWRWACWLVRGACRG